MARILLIVEDRDDVARAYRRYFARHFDAVYVSASPAAAEEVLRGGAAPTHLVCDYWLGEGETVGSELVVRWRQAYPSLVRAVLVSGSQVSEIPRTAGIDAVFEKPVNPAVILAALR